MRLTAAALPQAGQNFVSKLFEQALQIITVAGLGTGINTQARKHKYINYFLICRPNDTEQSPGKNTEICAAFS
jgi:hypothetical protein